MARRSHLQHVNLSNLDGKMAGWQDDPSQHLEYCWSGTIWCVSWFLNDPSWHGKVATCWKTLSTITICNIRSIQQTKVQKMAKNLFFGSLDHSKMHFLDFWMILHDLVMLQNGRKRSVLSQYAISSWSDQPNWRKWPILNWIIQKYTAVHVSYSYSYSKELSCKKNQKNP